MEGSIPSSEVGTPGEPHPTPPGANAPSLGQHRPPATPDQAVLGPPSATASALAIALAVPERLGAVEAHLRQLEDAILTLATAIGRQRSQVTADVDDIVAHQGLALRRLLEAVLERLPDPAADQSPLPVTRAERRRHQRAKRREARARVRAERAASKLAKATAKAASKAARHARQRRGQLIIPSLFLLVGLAGGAAVGLSPYEAGDDTCDGPLSSTVGAAMGTPGVTPVEACERAAADRMLLATVPALGGVMAAVAVVVMSKDTRRETSAAVPGTSALAG